MLVEGVELQFVKNATFVKHSKEKHNKMMYACIHIPMVSLIFKSRE